MDTKLINNVNQLVELLQLKTNQNPNKTAYTFLLDGESKEQNWTYHDLHTRACVIAAAIQELGIPKNERALLLYEPGLDYIAAFFGCLYADIIAIPVYIPYNSETITKINHIIKNATPKLCLTTKKIRSQLKKLDIVNWLGHQPLLNLVTNKFAKKALDHATQLANCHMEQLAWLSSDTLPLHLSNHWKQPHIDAEQIAFLQYTSGSTGHPKGVMVSHANLLHNLSVSQKCAGLTESKEVVGWLPPYHDMGLISMILLPIYCGGTSRLMSPIAFLQRPARWLQAISKYRAASSGGPNFAYELCVTKMTTDDMKGLDLSCWETTAVGAEPIRANTLKKFREKFAPYGFKQETFFPCYGLAESTLIVSGASSPVGRTVHLATVSKNNLQNNKVQITSESDEQKHILVGSGPSIHDQEIIIVDPETQTPCTENQIGEVWVSGPSVACGYWQEPELTKQIFHAHLNNGQGPYLRTGDLGFLKDKQLYITGRLKDLIIIHGFNHYPQDIELTVEESHPSLRPGCQAAFAIEHEDQEKLVIVQEIRIDQSQDYTNIAAIIRNRVFKLHGVNPYAILLVKPKTLSKTTSGKIRRQTCRQLYLNNQLATLFTDQQNPNDVQSSTLATKINLQSEEVQSSLSIHSLIKQLAHITHLPATEIQEDWHLSELGINSLTLVELQYSIEKQFQVQIPMEFLLTDPTIKAIYSLLEHTSTEWSYTQHIDWHNEFEECKYHVNFVPPYSSDSKQNVLLTGATGFLGAYLLKEMLEQTSYIIYCVVKAPDDTLGMHKIENNMQTYGLWNEDYTVRIKPVLGDLTLPKLGFSDSTYDDLAARMDLIYHNGAVLNFVYPYSRLKQANVSGTREILIFAAAHKLKPVHYISTVGYFLSADLPANSKINEKFDLSHHQGIYGGYNQSKWLAEKVVKYAQSIGVPTTIYRPGLIAGDSRTGQINTNDFISRMLKGFLHLSASPDLDTELDLVPVDFVAKAIVHLSIQSDSVGETYHLVNPQPIRFKEVIACLNKGMEKIKSIPYKEWQQKLIVYCGQDKTNPLYPLLPFFTDKIPNKDFSMFELYTQPNRPSICCANTIKKLSASQIYCSIIDEQLMAKYLNCLI